jgi:UDP-glucose 4-epimerase
MNGPSEPQPSIETNANPRFENPLTTLVAGGAGYIDSHTVYALLDRGEKFGVPDDLSAGMRGQVGAPAFFVQGDVADTPLVDEIITRHGGVIHFASSCAGIGSQSARLLRKQVTRSHSLIAASVAAG